MITDLQSLAVQIGEEHRLAEAAANTAIDHARAAGELLFSAKLLCAHGRWQSWLAGNFPASARTARSYMLVAERWPAIEAKRQRVANLSYREALRLTVEQREAPRKAATRVSLKYPPPQDLDGHRWVAISDGYEVAEICPCERDARYCYVAVANDMNTAAAFLNYTRRGVQLPHAHIALEAFGFVASHRWIPQEWNGAAPWYVTDPSLPGVFRPGVARA